MADSKISALSGVSSVAGSEEFPCNNAGATEKATAIQLSQWAESRLQQGVVCSKSAAQTITSGAWADLTWGAEVWKVGDTSIHSTSTLTDRLVAQISGEYLPTGVIQFDDTASDFTVGVQIYKNGSTVLSRIYARTLEKASFGVSVPVPPVPVQLSAADYITCQVYHNLGSDHDVVVNYSRFGMYLLGR
jgi:hypothetical protein